MSLLPYQLVVTMLLAPVILGAQAEAGDMSGALPGPFKASYTLINKGLRIGVMERELLVEGDGVRAFRSESKASGLVRLFRKDRIVELTRWAEDGPDFRPLYYEYHRSGGDKERSVNVYFDREQSQIRTTVNEQTWQMDLEPEIMDKLLYQVVLMRDLAAGERVLDYQIADGGKIKNYRLVSIGTEQVSTPLGQFEAIKLRREKKNSKREAILWCAPALNYLPIKVDYREKDGDLTTAVLNSVSGISLPGEL